MLFVLVILGLGVLVALLIWLGSGGGKRRRGARRAHRLEEEFLRLARLPAREGEALLARTLADLDRRYPQKSRIWKLEKAIVDLRRDIR